MLWQGWGRVYLIHGRVGNDMVRLTRTELPYPIKVIHRPILSYLVYRLGSEVSGKE